ncbi:MAG: DMT family transporter [Pseudomonadota bacterium]
MNGREFLVYCILCLAWGLHYVVIKIGVGVLPPMFYGALRMTLLAAILSPFLRWRPGTMRTVIAAAVFLGGVNYGFLFSGLSLATASAGAIAYQLYIPFATLLAAVFLKESIGLKRIIGISCALSGVIIIALGYEKAPGAADGNVLIGFGLVACCALCEATGSIFVKLAKGFKPHELLAWAAIVGACVLWSLTLLFETGQGEAFIEGDKSVVIAVILYSVVGASIIGHGSFYWLLQNVPVFIVSSSALMVTVSGVLFGVLLLGEPLTLNFIVGGTIALISVGFVIWRNADAKKESSRET